jgi:hypothetical protein
MARSIGRVSVVRPSTKHDEIQYNMDQGQIPERAALWKIEGYYDAPSSGDFATIYVLTNDNLSIPDVHWALRQVHPDARFSSVESIEFIHAWTLSKADYKWHLGDIVSQHDVEISPHALGIIGDELAAMISDDDYEISSYDIDPNTEYSDVVDCLNGELTSAQMQADRLESEIASLKKQLESIPLPPAAIANDPVGIPTCNPAAFRNDHASEFFRLATALFNKLPNRQLQRMIRIMWNWNRHENVK